MTKISFDLGNLVVRNIQFRKKIIKYLSSNIDSLFIESGIIFTETYKIQRIAN
jgi:hypothetical protein